MMILDSGLLFGATLYFFRVFLMPHIFKFLFIWIGLQTLKNVILTQSLAGEKTFANNEQRRTSTHFAFTLESERVSSLTRTSGWTQYRLDVPFLIIVFG